MTQDQFYKEVCEAVKDYCRKTNNVFVTPSRDQVNKDNEAGKSIIGSVRAFIEEWYTDGK